MAGLSRSLSAGGSFVVELWGLSTSPNRNTLGQERYHASCDCFRRGHVPQSWGAARGVMFQALPGQDFFMEIFELLFQVGATVMSVLAILTYDGPVTWE
eukprot:gene11628-biopygen3591